MPASTRASRSRKSVSRDSSPPHKVSRFDVTSFAEYRSDRNTPARPLAALARLRDVGIVDRSHSRLDRKPARKPAHEAEPAADTAEAAQAGDAGGKIEAAQPVESADARQPADKPDTPAQRDSAEVEDSAETSGDVAAEEKSPSAAPAKDADRAEKQAAPAEKQAAPAEKAPAAGAKQDGSSGGPAARMASLDGQLPIPMLRGLAGVHAAVTGDVGERRAALVNNPPQMKRPSGAPHSHQRPPRAPAVSAAKLPTRIKQLPAGRSVPTPRPRAVTARSSGGRQIGKPALQGGKQGKLTSADMRNLKRSLHSLPTTDRSLAMTAGAAPRLSLQGNASPTGMTRQSAQMSRDVGAARRAARAEASQSMGEDRIYPVVPAETLKATVKAGGKARAPATVPDYGDAEQAISLTAREEQGAAIQAAVARARGELDARKQEHEARRAAETQKFNQETQRLIEDNTRAQTAERAKAQAAVQGQRQQWTAEQGRVAAQANAEARKVQAQGQRDVAKQQTQANTEAAQHIQHGNREAAQAREQAESEAAREKAKASKESSGGLFGWLASKVGNFFESIKNAIKNAFDKARQFIKTTIDKAKKLAANAIEKARQAAVVIIQKAGSALIALGNRALADFPKLRKKFQQGMRSKIAQAQTAVNGLAGKLKTGVNKALDAAGTELNKALGALERDMLAAVDDMNNTVQGAIKSAKKFVDKVGAFAALIKDVALDPLGWLDKLRAAVMDGIQNHLWKAFQKDVREWFNQKLESVLGLGAEMWDLIKRGGIELAQIGAMAWDGLKAMIPSALIQALIETLVKMVVPGAGALMVIIEGLQAAWGAVQRILAAFERFFAFLLAVKTGKAGPKFAQALSAAAIAVLDFVANWLLQKLAKGAAKIGEKIKRFVRKFANKRRGKGKGKGTGKGTQHSAKDGKRDKQNEKDEKDEKDEKGKKDEKDKEGKDSNKKTPAQLRAALRHAKSITSTEEKKRTPADQVVAKLNTLKRSYKWIKSFKKISVGEGVSIHMIASNHLIKEDYLRKLLLKKATKLYSIEGKVGEYRSLLGTPARRSETVDVDGKTLRIAANFERDHQPQAALIHAFATLRVDGYPIFKGTKLETDGRSKKARGGFAIFLGAHRHMQTRTFRGRGSGTKQQALARFDQKAKSKMVSAGDQFAPLKNPQSGDAKQASAPLRALAIEVMNDELKEDVNTLENKLSSEEAWQDVNSLKAAGLTKSQITKLQEHIRKKIHRGENKMRAQNLDRFKD